MQEKDLINSFINNKENTMNLIVSNSVGMALRELSRVYFSTKMDLEKKYQDCMEEIKKQAPNQYKDSAAYLDEVAKEKLDSDLDRLTLFLENKNEFFAFPLKEVIALVWLALQDKKQYDSASPAAEEEDHQHRLNSFFLCLEKLKNNPVCHQGTRNELVFLLNKIYPNIHLIEDEKATVFYTLKEQFTQKFLADYQEAGEELKRKLLSVFIHALSSNDCRDLEQFIDPQQTVIKQIQDLFVTHGTNPQISRIKNLINSAMMSLELSFDPIKNKELYSIQLLFTEFIALPQQTPQNQALKCMQEWVKNKADLTNPADMHQLQLFCFYNELFALFHKHQFLLNLTGKINESTRKLVQEAEDYFKLLTMKQMPDPIITEAKRMQKFKLIADIENAKKNKMSDYIENFFCKWFSQDLEKDQLLPLQKNLYAFLTDPTMQAKIILSDKEINLIYNSQQEEFLDLSPYLINRILLQAIITPAAQWSNLFGGSLANDSSAIKGGLFPQVLNFIKQNFNQKGQQLGIQLKKDSYPPILMDQLDYLLEVYRKNLWSDLTEEQQQSRKALDVLNEIKPPENIIKLPQWISSDKDWFFLRQYITDQHYETYRSKFENILKKTINHSSLYQTILSIPEPFRFSFISLIADKQTELILDSTDLIFLLRKVPMVNQIELMNTYGKSFSIFTSKWFFPQVLSILPTENWDSFIKILGEKKCNSLLCGNISNILRDLSKEGARAALINILEENCKVFIPDGEELEIVLSLLPEKNRAVLIERLNTHCQQLIKNGSKLGNILKLLPEKEHIKLINYLGEDFNKLTHTAVQFVCVITNLSVNCWNWYIEARKEHFNILCKKEGFTRILELFYSKEKKELLIKTLGEDCRNYILSTAELRKVLSLLSEEGKSILMRNLKNHYKFYFKNGDELASILKILPKQEKLKLIANLGYHCKSIVTNTPELINVLKNLPEEKRGILINLLGENCKSIIKNSLLADILSLIPQYKTLAQALIEPNFGLNFRLFKSPAKQEATESKVANQFSF